MTMPLTDRSAMSSPSSALSAPNLPRFRVLAGVAKRQPASAKAVPMVCVPRSRPISAPPCASAERKSAALVVTTFWVSLTLISAYVGYRDIFTSEIAAA